MFSTVKRLHLDRGDVSLALTLWNFCCMFHIVVLELKTVIIISEYILIRDCNLVLRPLGQRLRARTWRIAGLRTKETQIPTCGHHVTRIWDLWCVCDPT